MYHAIEEEANKAHEEYDSSDDSESPELSPLRRPKRAPTAESTLAEEGLSQKLSLPTEIVHRPPSLPKEDPPPTDFAQP